MDSNNTRRVQGGIAQLHASDYPSGEPLDLSVSINPFGPPDVVRKAIEQAPITSYPDPHCHVARSRLATWLGTDVERIVLGNGAAELLWTLARTLLQPRETSLHWEPCFAELPAAVSAVGARAVTVRWRPEQALGEALASFRAALEHHHPRVAYLCAPSSPFGCHVPAAAIAELVQSFARTTFVVDQSFLTLSPFAEEVQHALPENAVAVRSLTKELGIPGVRVGYAIARADLARRLQDQRPQWSVSAAALAAVESYPDATADVHRAAHTLLQLKSELVGSLTRLGIRCHRSDTQYFVAELPQHSQLTAAQLNERLLETHRVYVRDCASFGSPRCFRVSAHPEQARLVAALEAILSQLPP